ncbi:hypothetical protein ACOSP7_001637 [Xanthoceras sorbifolium]
MVHNALVFLCVLWCKSWFIKCDTCKVVGCLASASIFLAPEMPYAVCIKIKHNIVCNLFLWRCVSMFLDCSVILFNTWQMYSVDGSVGINIVGEFYVSDSSSCNLVAMYPCLGEIEVCHVLTTKE